MAIEARIYCRRCRCNRDRKHFSTTGRFAHCFRCEGNRKRYYLKYRTRLILKSRMHYRANRDQHNRTQAEWKRTNPNWVTDYNKKNRLSINARMREWRKRNRDKVNATNRRYLSKTRHDPRFSIIRALRCRLNNLIRRNQMKNKADKTIALLGCSLPSFRIYIESQFESGMTWENYGRHWHLDHIIPCALFDLSRPEHQRRCFHFSNMQPLWASDNLHKSSSSVYKSAEEIPHGY